MKKISILFFILSILNVHTTIHAEEQFPEDIQVFSESSAGEIFKNWTTTIQAMVDSLIHSTNNTQKTYLFKDINFIIKNKNRVTEQAIRQVIYENPILQNIEEELIDDLISDIIVSFSDLNRFKYRFFIYLSLADLLKHDLINYNEKDSLEAQLTYYMKQLVHDYLQHEHIQDHVEALKIHFNNIFKMEGPEDISPESEEALEMQQAMLMRFTLKNMNLPDEIDIDELDLLDLQKLFLEYVLKLNSKRQE